MNFLFAEKQYQIVIMIVTENILCDLIDLVSKFKDPFLDSGMVMITIIYPHPQTIINNKYVISPKNRIRILKHKHLIYVYKR